MADSNQTTPNQIKKTIELKAPVPRVWTALTDHIQFGEWFRVKLAEPFKLGKPASGTVTYKGYEHLKWTVNVTEIEFQRLFAFTWHPYAIDPSIDYGNETPTLVEFFLEKSGAGTKLTITESGFDKVPSERRALAYRMNDGGWQTQTLNIEAYLAEKP